MSDSTPHAGLILEWIVEKSFMSLLFPLAATSEFKSLTKWIYINSPIKSLHMANIFAVFSKKQYAWTSY